MGGEDVGAQQLWRGLGCLGDRGQGSGCWERRALASMQHVDLRSGAVWTLQPLFCAAPEP